MINEERGMMLLDRGDPQDGADVYPRSDLLLSFYAGAPVPNGLLGFASLLCNKIGTCRT